MNQSMNRVHRDFKENGVKSKRQSFYKNRSPNEVVESKNTRSVLFIRLSWLKLFSVARNTLFCKLWYQSVKKHSKRS